MIKEIAKFIESKTSFVIGTDLFVGHRLQDSPDRCQVILESGGGKPYFDLPDRIDKAIQVISRAKTYFNARDDAWAIYKAIFSDCIKGSTGWSLPILTPGTEALADGDLELWTTPTDLTSWTEAKAGTSSINRESIIVQHGTYSARLDVDASNSTVRIIQGPSLTPLKKYKLSLYYMMSLAGKTAQIRLRDTGPNVYLDLNGNWQVGAVDILLENRTSWTLFELIFNAHEDYSTYSLQLYNNIAPNSSIYLDNISLVKDRKEYETMVIEPISDPQYIGQDEKGRFEFSTNFIFRIKDK